ncbi:MAG: biotin synthase BioB [Candidatus Lambdaproteobacteria bacterium RIFOXYD12_FULL_49_8]|uniref:Biotin synthase n=1 Tax=Candidatus Lambdaproteobacteria bacterium RIFOXYD2_FULL_50_16 TaxID=1817772 RepID=A0A1F6G6A8_9PROT|nr:MAG: biotin synthase BioB [Candidatus Lambdaproteobacteria bacterium RIFOXYD2_FULL_50_16]OGG97871.1 MAG: biotin synthase BioB [Candidatus Lambdaproteobacteria bacterium RIFOXYD12_FULL_49_8]
MQKPRVWNRTQIAEIYHQPLLELVYQAAQIHREFHKPSEVQVCTLQSIKTGGCAEDCGYCSQSVHHQASVERQKLLDVDKVLALAKEAKAGGSTRFCMGAAGREVRDDPDFERILEMVKGVSGMGLEVCCTLGMLEEEQAKKLKSAGLYAYNHNLDTGEKYYSKVTSTRSYQERLDTIDSVGKAGISLCCGGILGMGETVEDRIDLLYTLSSLSPAPESVPVNALVPIEGTPMADMGRVDIWDLVRMIATARICIPTAMVRLSAGRESLSDLEQAFCFMAGANSIFSGDKLLTTPGAGREEDLRVFTLLGLRPRQPYLGEKM